MNNQLHVLEPIPTCHRRPRAVPPEQCNSAVARTDSTASWSASSTRAQVILPHFFDEEWRVRSDTYTFGHDIEAKLAVGEAAEELVRIFRTQHGTPTARSAGLRPGRRPNGWETPGRRPGLRRV